MPHSLLSALARISFVLLLTVLTGCTEPEPAWTPPAPGAPTRAGSAPALPTQALESIAVYFVHPDSGAPDAEALLVQAVDQAQRSIDLAIYNFTLEDLGDALLAAQRRGVSVRVVMESENADALLPAGLVEAGVPLVGDEREALMHNKFLVIDGREVWTGSLNFARGALDQDSNNLLRIVDPDLAADYQAEFNEMFDERRFGAESRPGMPAPLATVGDTRVEVFFSPDDNAQDRIVALVQDAEREIRFLAYSFTADPIAEAMIAAAADGVAVAGVMDSEQAASNQGSEYARLAASGVDVRLDGDPGLLHHKVIVLDGQVVITGSYNFSRAAEERNDENLLVIHSADLARQYLAEFDRVYAESSEP